ncbi:MAG TPA: BamA/TamA family outer membrane protein, partial [Nitrospiria bacterium]|nr:BamA/TamA family outer membrane protein [Nitrospiria bacterium]
EVLGDNAIHGTVELLTPPFEKFLPASIQEELRMRVFYDAAYLWLKSAPPGQSKNFQLEGSGFGAQLKLTDHLFARIDQAWAWKTAVVTHKNDYFTHFEIQTSF